MGSDSEKILLGCKHCGLTPSLKTRTVVSCGGWSYDEMGWIECPCGMRTIEIELTYNKADKIKWLINIFKGRCDDE